MDQRKKPKKVLDARADEGAKSANQTNTNTNMKTNTKRILIMRHNKIFSAAIALCVIAFCTMGWVPSSWASPPTPVTITGVYDFSTFPLVFGTFTTSGALTISGPTSMYIDLNINGRRGHCVVTLEASDGTGTITIHQECEFGSSPPTGRWQIVSGTGAYANLRGNGSLLMPPDTEAMTGVIS